jgi:hypothetical protein
MCKKEERGEHPLGWKIVAEHGPLLIKTTVYVDPKGFLHTIQRVVKLEEEVE